MRNVLLGLMLLSAVGPLLGCDEPARPKRPPANSNAEETTDDLRERRRAGSTFDDDATRDGDDRYADQGDREERRRPDFRDRQSTAAEEAEDERDAAADRPTRAKEE